MKRIVCGCLVTGISMMFAYALADQQEKLTVTTYYPAPTAVYQTLRVNPGEVSQVSDPQPGQVYYNATDDTFMYLNKSNAWLNWGGGGGASGLWEQNATTKNIYSINPGHKVGMGISSPSATLHIGNATGRTVNVNDTSPIAFNMYNILFGYCAISSPKLTQGMGTDYNNMFFTTASAGDASYYFFQNGTSVLMYLDSSQRLGINTTAPVQRVDVNGAMRLAPISAPASVTGSLYYNNTTDTLAYRDATQWNNFISEYGSANLTRLTNDTVNITFRKTYSTPPLVFPTVSQKGVRGEWETYVYIANVTTTQVRFKVQARGRWDGSVGEDISQMNFTYYYAPNQTVQVDYIVIPQ